MRTTRLVILAVSVAASALGCTDHPQTYGGPSQAAQRLTITVPSRIAPATTVPFTATAYMTDGTTQDYSARVLWRTTDATVLTVAASGQATTHSIGEAQVSAQAGTLTAQAKVLVIPPGTYKLAGRVSESTYAVTGATVTVTSGVGQGLSTQSSSSGDYRLYGVAGEIQVSVSKDGYTTAQQTLIVSEDTVADLAITQTNQLQNIAGSYALAFSLDVGCGPPGNLPDQYKQRHYTASLTQDGPSFRVQLSGANFVVKDGLGNGFSGRIEPAGISFVIGDGYYTPYPDILESLPDGHALLVSGFGTLAVSGSDLLGSINGGIYISSSPQNYSSSALWCWSDKMSVALTRQASVQRIRR